MEYLKVFWTSLCIVFTFKLSITVVQFLDAFIAVEVPKEIANRTIFNGLLGTNFVFKGLMFLALFLVAALAYSLTWYTYKVVDQVFFKDTK